MNKIVGVKHTTIQNQNIEFDINLALKFEVDPKRLGGSRYIYLGDEATQMIEIEFPENSMILCGFSVIIAKKFSKHKFSGIASCFSGLPIFMEIDDSHCRGDYGSRHIDTYIDFYSFIGENYIEIQIDGYHKFNKCIQYKDIEFLMLEDNLSGIRILNRTKSELELFIQHMTRYVE